MSVETDLLWVQVKAELEIAKVNLENALEMFEKLKPRRETNGIEAYNLIEFTVYDALCCALEKLEEPYR